MKVLGWATVIPGLNIVSLSLCQTRGGDSQGFDK